METILPRAQLSGHGLDAIVIGGSAGSIEGLLQLLPALPAALRIPVFLVVHVPPSPPSPLTDLFARRCGLRVCEAQDKMPVAPGRLVVAPPDYHMLVERDGRIALSLDQPVYYSRPSIDVLFESARWAYGHRVLGIVLSGASEDGAVGLAGIDAAGGLAWVQDPSTAQATLMPRAALRMASHARRMTVASMARAVGALAQ